MATEGVAIRVTSEDTEQTARDVRTVNEQMAALARLLEESARAAETSKTAVQELSKENRILGEELRRANEAMVDMAQKAAAGAAEQARHLGQEFQVAAHDGSNLGKVVLELVKHMVLWELAILAIKRAVPQAFAAAKGAAADALASAAAGTGKLAVAARVLQATLQKTSAVMATIAASGFGQKFGQATSSALKPVTFLLGRISAQVAKLHPALIGLLATIAGFAALRRLQALAEETAAVTGVTEAYTNLTKALRVQEGLLQDLRQATRGTIDDVKLMELAILGLNSEAIPSGEILTELATHARVLGRSMQLDAAKSMEDMIRGIGLMNPTLLKNLGVLVSAEEAYRDYAEAIGKSTDELTDHEKHTAFLNLALERIRVASARVAGASTTNFRELTGELQALGAAGAALATQLGPSEDLMEQLAKTGGDMAEVQQRQATASTNLKNSLGGILRDSPDYLAFMKAGREATIDVTNATVELVEAFKKLFHWQVELPSTGMRPFGERGLFGGLDDAVIFPMQQKIDGLLGAVADKLDWVEGKAVDLGKAGVNAIGDLIGPSELFASTLDRLDEKTGSVAMNQEQYNRALEKFHGLVGQNDQALQNLFGSAGQLPVGGSPFGGGPAAAPAAAGTAGGGAGRGLSAIGRMDPKQFEDLSRNVDSARTALQQARLQMALFEEAHEGALTPANEEWVAHGDRVREARQELEGLLALYRREMPEALAEAERAAESLHSSITFGIDRAEQRLSELFGTMESHGELGGGGMPPVNIRAPSQPGTDLQPLMMRDSLRGALTAGFTRADFEMANTIMGQVSEGVRGGTPLENFLNHEDVKGAMEVLGKSADDLKEDLEGSADNSRLAEQAIHGLSSTLVTLISTGSSAAAMIGTLSSQLGSMLSMAGAGPLGAAIQGVGAVAGALLGNREREKEEERRRRRETMRVRIEEYSQRAIDQQKVIFPPERVIVEILSRGGDARRVQHDLRRLEARDAVTRLPAQYVQP